MPLRKKSYVNYFNSSSQLDEVNCENSALKDRLAMLQQDVQRMEEEIIKKK